MMDSYIKAGKIVSEVRSDASEMIKEGCLILDLVEYVESEILKKGAGIAFPCNVSVNEIAAHYTSPTNDKSVIHAGDIVKLDLGAHINGYIADSAITVMAKGDITERYSQDEINQNEEIIEASAAGLEAAIASVRAGAELGKIGAAVHEAISDYGLNPIYNLTGHSLEHYNLHAGLSVPNYDNSDPYKLEEGQAIAIEPFATTGKGIVNDMPGHYIYSFMADKPFRMKSTQKVFTHIKKNNAYLPFSGRWITEKFGERRGNTALKQLSEAMAIYPYAPLREKAGCFVSQKEHTVIVEKEGCTVTTL